jgi:hypothetical protein
MSVVIVAGAVANQPGIGGIVWEKMSWVSGLRRLGFDVYFVEQIAPATCIDDSGAAANFEDSINLRWFRSIFESFGRNDRCALVATPGEPCHGLSWQRLLDVAASAELLINISGHLTLAPVLGRIRRTAYLDVDPGFTQFWHADPKTPFTIREHDYYFTIGENIGLPGCPIPTAGIRWRPTRQPVVLEDWPVVAAANRGLFTTVASWRGPFGPVNVAGRPFGLKVHEFRKYMALPAKCRPSLDGPTFEVALSIHSADAKDQALLIENGWRLVDPRLVAGDPQVFRGYIQRSGAEWSVAQGLYVDTSSGWFSERSARYLASGKPVLVQDTGFARHLPTGEGLISFGNLDEAIAGANDIVENYERHSAAARAIAEDHFDSDRVIGRFIEEIGIKP